MKSGSKLPGILLIVVAFVMGVVEQFWLAIIFALAGLAALAGIGAPKAKQENAAQPQQKAQPRQQAQSRRQTVSPTAAPASGAPAADCYAYQGTPHQYFNELLRNCFPGFTVRQNVDLRSLTGAFGSSQSWSCACGSSNTGKFCVNCGAPRPAVSQEWVCSCGCKCSGKFCDQCGAPRPAVTSGSSGSVTFALYEGSTPKCAIILCPSNDWDSDPVESAMAACASAGIPCLRFMENFRNQSGYVVNRIRKAMR